MSTSALSDIIAITNSNDDSESSWKIFFFWFSLQLSFSSGFQSLFPVFHGLSNKLYDFVGYFVHGETVY